MIKLKDLLSERTYVSNVKKVGKLQKWTIVKGGKKVDVLGSKKFFDDGRGFSTNDPDDALMLWNLGKKFKGKQVPDVYGEGTCGYGENGELGEEPAGPHLIKKKMKEEVEPIGGMAKIAKIVKDKQHAKVGGQTVDMQSANLLMKLYNAVKDKDKEKMNKMSEKKLIMVLGKLWSRVKLKLPVQERKVKLTKSKLKEVIREVLEEETINEINFDKIKLPSVVNRFLGKFVDSMKGANLNRMKRAAILYKVIDAAGMTPQQLMADIQKIKTAMKND